MKKIFFIAALSILLGAITTMHTMEKENSYWSNLPDELKLLIAYKLDSAENLDSAVKNIQSCAKTCLSFKKIVYDKRLTNYLIASLARRFQNNDKLFVAAMLGTPHAIEWIKAKTHTRNNYRLLAGEYFVDVAERNKSLDIVKSIIKTRINLDTIFFNVDKYEMTPLMFAACVGNVKLVKLLFDYNATSNIRNNIDFTALTWAAFNGHTEVVKLLLEYGADINVHNNKNWSPLTQSIRNGHVEIVKLLLANGAKVNVNSKIVNNNMTALTLASDNNRIEIVRLLLDHGADINVGNHENYTALIIAAALGHMDLVKLLLEHGADVTLKNDGGYTAFDLAQQGGHSEVIDILKKAITKQKIKKKRCIIS